jgi:hypothetical protein
MVNARIRGDQQRTAVPREIQSRRGETRIDALKVGQAAILPNRCDSDVIPSETRTIFEPRTVPKVRRNTQATTAGKVVVEEHLTCPVRIDAIDRIRQPIRQTGLGQKAEIRRGHRSVKPYGTRCIDIGHVNPISRDVGCVSNLGV